MAEGISQFTAQATARAALIRAARTALAGEDVDIRPGFRWPFISQDWVAATATESQIDPATIGPRRSLDETITLTLSIGSWRAGFDEETEVAAFDRAFWLLAQIQEHVRTQDITLGGTVLWCVPGSSQSDGETLASESGEGRITEISAQFVCLHRITTP